MARDRVAVDELPADLEARHGLAGLPRHRAVALSAVEARHRSAEGEVLGERHVAEVPALVLPGVVVAGDDLLNGHLDSHLPWIDSQVHPLDTAGERN
jgi:hypothetical protein